MKKNLPYLNNERLDMIFEHVYENAEKVDEHKFNEEELSHLLITLKSMQSFNFRHRPDDTQELFGLLDGIFNFERNSEATTLWLSLILAIKELYGFSDRKLLTVMKKVSIRK
jgi:hypothetical protein